MNEHEVLLMQKTQLHQFLLQRILSIGVDNFLDILHSKNYFPSQHIAQVIGIFKKIPLVIWGKHLTHFQLKARFICGFNYQEPIPERCVHVFTNDENHFMHLQIEAIIQGPALQSGEFRRLLRNTEPQDVLLKDNPQPRRSARLQTQIQNHHPVDYHPIVTRRHIQREPIPKEESDQESSDSDDDRPHETREWRQTLVDWRYGFARGSGFLSTATGTTKQRETAIDILLSKNPSNSVSSTEENWNKKQEARLNNLFACRCCGTTQSTRPRILSRNSPKLDCLKVNTSTWMNDEVPEDHKWRTKLKIKEQWFYLLSDSHTCSNDENSMEHIDETLTFCRECFKSLKKGEIPKWSLAHSNLDYGILPDLPALTFAEQLVISISILHGHILKLNSGQFAHKGHFISFRHDSAFATSLHTSSLPRTDLSKTIIIVNIGPNRTAADLRRHASVKKRLEVKAENIYLWLNFLKHRNPLYRDVIINNNIETHQSLNGITDRLVETAVQSNEEQVITAERVATASHVVGHSDDDLSEDTQDDLTQVSMTMEQVEQVMNTELPTDDQRDISDVFITERIDEQVNANNAPSALDTIATTLRIPIEEIQPISAHHDTVPSNEFVCNDQIIMGAFPYLFPLGQGLGRLPNGPVPPSASKRLLLQYDGRFRKQPSLLFLLFNQMQRHSLCHSIAGRFKGNLAEENMRAFIERISSPEFIIDLDQSLADPNSKQAKELSSYIERHIKPISSTVPWSDDERKSELSKLLAMIQYFGPPSFFCTINPCDMDSNFMLRMTSTCNDTPYQRQFHLPNIEIENALQRAAILADSPVESALAYSWLIDDIFSTIYNLPMNNRTDLPHPEQRVTTLFGKVLSAFGVHEAQGRGSLHFHFLLWTDILFDQVIRHDYRDDTHEKLQHKLDSIISCSIPQQYASSQPTVPIDMPKIRLNTALGTMPMSIHDPNYAQYIRTLVEATQCHIHSVTCRKGKTGIRHCRMSFPQACVDLPTGFRQLTKKEDGKVVLKMNLDLPPTEPNDAQELLWFEDPRRLVLELTRPSDGIKKMSDTLLFFPARHNTKEMGLSDESEIDDLLRDILTQFTQSQATHTQPFQDQTTIQRAINILQEFDPRSDRNIIGSNSNVVPYNPTLLGLLRCNMAMLPIGGCQQARVVIFYVAKYITKPAVSPTTILPLLKLSYKDVTETFPSVAEDTGTAERTAKHLLARIINKRFGLCEYSAQQASAAILNVQPSISSHLFWNVYVNPLIDYAKKEGLIHNREITAEEGDDDSIDIDQLLQEFDDEIQAPSNPFGYPQLEEPVRSLFENLNCQDDTAEHTIGLKIYNEIDETAPEDAPKQAKVVAKPQHYYYLHRGFELSSLSLYEYAALVDVIPKTRKKYGGTHGRKPNPTFEFDATADKDIQDHFMQRLRSKTRVPRLCGARGPHNPGSPPPESVSSKALRKWELLADNFAIFTLCLFCPWTTTPPYRPLHELSRDGLTDFVQKLMISSSEVLDDSENNKERYISAAILRWILNQSATCAPSSTMEMMSKWKNRASHRWSAADVEEIRKEQEAASVGGRAFDYDDDSAEIDRLEDVINGLLPHAESERDVELQRGIDERLALLPPLRVPSPPSSNSSSHSIHPSDYLIHDALQASSSLAHIQESADASKLGRQNRAEQVLLDLINSNNHTQSQSNIMDTDPPQSIEERLNNHFEQQMHLLDQIPVLSPDQCECVLKMIKLFKWSVKHHCDTVSQPQTGVRSNTASNVAPPPILTLGGPGTGKSTLLHRFYQILGPFSDLVKFSATTGNAATLLPKGQTIHSALGFGREGLNKSSPSKSTIEDLRTCVMIIIDEVSMLSVKLFKDIVKTLRMVRNYDADSGPMFGNIGVVLTGDFFQLPAIGQALFSDKDVYINFFRHFELIRLQTQHRAGGDALHMTFLDKIRSFGDLNAATICNSVQRITVEDWQSARFKFAAILVPTNDLRIRINQSRIFHFALSKSCSVIKWRLPLKSRPNRPLTVGMNELYLQNSDLYAYFVPGAPVFLTKNIAVDYKLANGTNATLHSIVLSDDDQDLSNRLAAVLPGQEITLNASPRFVNVSVNLALPLEMRSIRPPGDVMDVDEAHSVIALSPSTEPIVCRLHDHNFKCKFMHPAYELMFSMTFHKAQGLTMDAVIADLGKPLSGSVPRPSLFVAFSRVRTSQSLRRLGDVGLNFDTTSMRWPKPLASFLNALAFPIERRPNNHLAPGIRSADALPGDLTAKRSRGRPKKSSIIINFTHDDRDDMQSTQLHTKRAAPPQTCATIAIPSSAPQKGPPPRQGKTTSAKTTAPIKRRKRQI